VYRIDTRDFNLDNTLSCGQVFRWEKIDWWTGVVSSEIIRVKQEGDELIINSSLGEKFIRDYFRLDDDMDRIYASINRDEKIASIIQKYRGLRLIRQDPWECLVSYICSSNNTIRNIKNSIRRMCECFGREIWRGYYSFPAPQVLAELELCDMEECRMGFRAPRVLEIASLIANHEFDLYGIKDLTYTEGREELLKIKGVGDKIADCVLLFAFGKLESFPVDTHIEQIMDRFYGGHFKNAKKSKKREAIADFARDYFGKYCGYGQEYLYMEDLR
jgi:N-glycosylase/DNA lyase